jgi:hypothetical protein
MGRTVRVFIFIVLNILQEPRTAWLYQTRSVRVFSFPDGTASVLQVCRNLIWAEISKFG